MFHYVIGLTAQQVTVLDTILMCRRHVDLMKLAAEATIKPRDPLTLISDTINVINALKDVEAAVFVWALELRGRTVGRAVASPELHAKIVDLLDAEYGDLPSRNPNFPDLVTFQGLQQQTLGAFRAAPLVDLEAEASVRTQSTPTGKLAN